MVFLGNSTGFNLVGLVGSGGEGGSKWDIKVVFKMFLHLAGTRQAGCNSGVKIEIGEIQKFFKVSLKKKTFLKNI
jgi:hypothetical protein